MLELGSGCGIAGIGLAQLYQNCNVLLTDLPEAMGVLESNIAQAQVAAGSNLSQAILNWDDNLPIDVTKEKYHLFLVSDCTYNSDSIPALIRTLRALIKISPRASIVVSMKVRHSSEVIFFDMMKDVDFQIVGEARMPLPDSHRNGVGQELENVEIYTFRSVQSLEQNPTSPCS